MQQVDLSAVTAFELINALKTRLSSTVAETNTRMLQALEYKIASVLAISRMELNRRVIPLPPEILGKILWLVPGPGVEPETSVWEPWSLNISDVIRLSHVCQQWRDVVKHNTSSLWCSAASRGPNAPIRQYIHDLTYDPEVKPHPLDLTLTSQPMTNDIMDGLLTRHCGDVREIHWVTPRPNDPTLVIPPQLLVMNVPNLEFFSLNMGNPNLDVAYPGPLLFRGNAFNLKVLSLHYIGWLPTNAFPALTHLSLAHIHNHLHILPATLNLLCNCPNLQDLVLDQCYYKTDISPTDPYSGPRQVRLDHLRKITFAAKKNPRPSIIRFLDHIDFDPHVVVSFVVPSSFEGFDLAGLISGCAGAITRLRLDEPPDGSCTICAVGPRCRFQAIISGYPANEFCESFADNLPLAAVRELWVRSYPFTLLQSFFNNATLERCSTLDTLVVCDHSLSESLQLLSFEVHPSFNRTYASLTTLRVLWTSTKPNMALMDNEFWDAKKLHGAFGVSLKHLIFEVPKEVGFQMDDAFVERMKHFSEFVRGAFFVPPTPDVSYASPKFRAVEWPAW